MTEEEAIGTARELARQLEHAAVVVRSGMRYVARDSWKPLPRGFVIVAFVSSGGHVTRARSA